MVHRMKCLALGLFMPIIFGLLRYAINQGDYYRNELWFVLMGGSFLLACIYYFQKNTSIDIHLLNKRQLFQVIQYLLLDLLFLCTYTSIFIVLSGASSGFAMQRSIGYSISLVLGIGLFAPIEEELFIRGAIQKETFHNSTLGLIPTSCFFAFLHDPRSVVSFGYYAISGIIYGYSYKVSDNILDPILCHIGHNSFVILSSLI